MGRGSAAGLAVWRCFFVRGRRGRGAACLSTRGQSVIRGLVTAGPCFGESIRACLRVERGPLPELLTVESLVFSSRCMRSGARVRGRVWGLVHDGQGPAPVGEFAGDRGSRRCASCVRGEYHPTVVEAPVAGVAARCGGSRRLSPPVPHDLPDPVWVLVTPGGLDQQSADMRVPRLGDRTQRAGTARGVLGRHQRQVSGDARPGEPMPVSDLDRESEPGQGRDPPRAPRPGRDRGELRVDTAIAVIPRSSRSRRARMLVTAS